MQLFRQRSVRPFTGPAARIAGLARAGRVRATQLELGAPLRWPGRFRDSLVGAVCASLASGEGDALRASRAAPASGAVTASEEDDQRPARPGGAFLQACDARAGASGLGIAAAMGAMPDGRLGARLLLFPGGQRIVLFTGEERRASGSRVGGLEVARDSRGSVHLSFRGPALLAADGGRHFRSEVEQASARMVEVRAVLALTPFGDHGFGEVAGSVAVDGQRWDLRAFGFSDLPPLRSVEAAEAPATRVAVGFAPDLGLTATIRRGAGIQGHRYVGSDRAPLEAAADGRAGPHPRPPASFALRLAEGRLTCSPVNHLTWLRPAGGCRYARITLGMATFSLEGAGRGSGFYEHVEALESPAAAGVAPPVSESEVA